MTALAAAASQDPPVAAQIFAGIGAVLLYWLPSIIGAVRRVPALGQVIVVNFFAFFLFFPWVIALVMAFRTPRSRAQAQQPASR